MSSQKKTNTKNKVKINDVEKPKLKDKGKDGKIWVAAYVRVSTKAEAQLTSIKNQPKKIKKLFDTPEIKEKYRLVWIYPDWGKSGTVLKRPYFDEMLADAGLKVTKKIDKAKDKNFPGHTFNRVKYTFDKAGEPLFDEIWVKNTSRFARNIGVNEILDELLYNGVIVKFLSPNLSTGNPKDKSVIINSIAADMAYSINLSNEIQAARKTAKEEGLLNSSGQLFGYDYHKRTRNNSPYYTINEEEAKIVRTIFELYAIGDGETDIIYGAKRIANYLAEKNMFTRNGKKFGTTTIRNMLTNEKYMGYLNPGKFTSGSVFNKFTSTQITNDYKKYMVLSEDTPAIVTPELWEKCQEVRGERFEKDSEHKSVKNIVQNKYGRFLKCKYCNGNFQFDNNKGKPFYACSTKRRNGVNACNVNNVQQPQLLELINSLKDGDYNELFRLDVEAKLRTLIYEIEKHLLNLETPVVIDDINKLEDKIKRQYKILDALIDNDSDEISDDLKKRTEKLRNNIIQYEEELKRKSSTPKELIFNINETIDNCYNIIDVYNNLQETYTEEEILEKIDRIEVFGVRQAGENPYKAGLMPVFKESVKLNKLISFNMPTYKYRFKQGIGDDPDDISDKNWESLDDETKINYAQRIKIEYPTKSHWAKVILDENLSTNAFDLETGYIKDIGLVDSPSIMEQTISKLDSLKTKSEEIIAKYPSTKIE